jgi:hypothetical protein
VDVEAKLTAFYKHLGDKLHAFDVEMKIASLECSHRPIAAVGLLLLAIAPGEQKARDQNQQRHADEQPRRRRRSWR